MNKFYFLLLAGLLSVNAFAENKQTVPIDGQAVGKTVKEITFDGDNVILSYSDNTSYTTKDMSLVSLAFTYDGTTGIDQVETGKKALQGKVFNLNGQYVGTSTEGLAKGVYIVNGKKVIIK